MHLFISFFVTDFVRKKGSVIFPSVLRYLNPEDQLFNCVISDISVVLRETTLTISYSIDKGSIVETEIARVVCLGTTKITEITRLKNDL